MQSDVYGIIYKITNIINNKSYIGQTIEKSLWHRYGCVDNHKNIIKNHHNEELKDDMIKYGFDNFTFDEIDVALNQDELDDKEIFYINKYNSHINGYNKGIGGGSNKKLYIVLNTGELFEGVANINKKYVDTISINSKCKCQDDGVVYMLYSDFVNDGRDMDVILDEFKYSNLDICRYNNCYDYYNCDVRWKCDYNTIITQCPKMTDNTAKLTERFRYEYYENY